VTIDEVDELAGALEGLRRTVRDGLVQWRYHGRLVARQLDETSIVLRSELPARDARCRRSPQTFSVAPRFRAHMMVVADLARGSSVEIEDALRAAWELQRRAEPPRLSGRRPPRAR
jgi:hypothetical protein